MQIAWPDRQRCSRVQPICNNDRHTSRMRGYDFGKSVIRTFASKNAACFSLILRTSAGWLKFFTFLEARARCTRPGKLRDFGLQPRRSNPRSRNLLWAIGVKSTWFLNFGGQAKCKLVLVVHSWPSLVVFEWWSRCEWRNMNKSEESYLFSFFEIAQSLITFLIAGNLTECVPVQLTWKLSRFFDSWREAHFSSPIPVVPSLKKKKKRKKKTVHSTNEDWSWKISPSFCWTFRNWFLLYFNFLSLIVTYSSQFTWQGHRKLQWATSKDEPLLSNCPLDSWAES